LTEKAGTKKKKEPPEGGSQFTSAMAKGVTRPDGA
jgi:hypothetical protein